MIFTVEEICLLKAFWGSEKMQTIKELEVAAGLTENKTLKINLLLLSVKLRVLCDNGYDRLYLDDYEKE